MFQTDDNLRVKNRSKELEANGFVLFIQTKPKTAQGFDLLLKQDQRQRKVSVSICLNKTKDSARL